MRALTEILKNGQWSGRPAFVVGSGPSLKHFDRSVLRGSLTIGCNEEYRWGPTISICSDYRFFKGDGTPGRIPARINPDWYHTSSIPVWFKGHPDSEPLEANDSIYLAQTAHTRETPFAWGTSLETGLYYGGNVGMTAINLAEILGADPICLLGFDCNAEQQATHCHDAYPPGWKLENIEERRKAYDRWIKEFDRIAPLIKASVWNLNLDSAINAFPKMTRDFALAYLRGDHNRFGCTGSNVL